MIDSFHSFGNSSLFQIELISLCSLEQIFLRLALINSAGIWSVPDDLNNHLNVKGTRLRDNGYCCMYFYMPNLIKHMYIQ